jgi:Lon protease-like protein
MSNIRNTVPGQSGRGEEITWKSKTMEMPLFPLKNVVLFPGMVLPLHIFELRYREMINRCIDERIPFGVVLIAEGQEVGKAAKPFMVGTAARIMRYERQDDGCINITTVGTQRIRILELDHSRSYLSASVASYPIVNGGTKIAADIAQRVRPLVLEYVDLLSTACNTNLRLDRLPEDPLTLAFLIAIAMQIKAEDKQKLLELMGVPEILSAESRMISREMKLMQFMVSTQKDVLDMNSGPTGYVFPN